MTSGQRVVVVDGVPETAAVLREVFAPRGHRVDRVRAFDLPEPTRRDAGSVLVVHDDGASESQRRHKYGTAPRVVIGSLTTETPTATNGDERRLSQPFHYAELIRAVESLLRDEGGRRNAA